MGLYYYCTICKTYYTYGLIIDCGNHYECKRCNELKKKEKKNNGKQQRKTI